METLLRLEQEVRAGRGEVAVARKEVTQLEVTLKQQQIRLEGQSAKHVTVEVRKLESDISGLRDNCDTMSNRVTALTGGKVPLGETSINFSDYLSPATAPALATNPAQPVQLWSCSECTFSNHPDIETCEICEMPRISLGGSAE